jgi:hypothetical protein
VHLQKFFLPIPASRLQFEPPLNPVMMLWVNLIMDTMGALALVRVMSWRRFIHLKVLTVYCIRFSALGVLQGTESPSLALLKRRPYSSTASLVQPRMMRHIIVQVRSLSQTKQKNNCLVRNVVVLFSRLLSLCCCKFQFVFQFAVVMALLVRGAEWFGVTNQFIDANGKHTTRRRILA